MIETFPNSVSMMEGAETCAPIQYSAKGFLSGLGKDINFGMNSLPPQS